MSCTCRDAPLYWSSCFEFWHAGCIADVICHIIFYAMSYFMSIGSGFRSSDTPNFVVLATLHKHHRGILYSKYKFAILTMLLLARQKYRHSGNAILHALILQNTAITQQICIQWEICTIYTLNHKNVTFYF